MEKYGNIETMEKNETQTANRDSGEHLRAKLSAISLSHRTALSDFDNLVADPKATFAAIEEADLRIKKLTAQRAYLMEELRLAQFEDSDRFGPYRTRVGQRPIREVVLDLLDELEVPVNPRMISDYCLATLHINIPATRFGSLRRDEERAYQRDPHARPAWVVPAINAIGLSAIPRLVASSAWEPKRRLIGARTLRTNHLKVLLALIRKANQAPEETGKSLMLMVSRFATWVPASTKTDFQGIGAAATAELKMIEEEDDKQRQTAADQLAKLPTQFQLWGRPSLLDGGNTAMAVATR